MTCLVRQQSNHLYLYDLGWDKNIKDSILESKKGQLKQTETVARVPVTEPPHKSTLVFAIHRISLLLLVLMIVKHLRAKLILGDNS